MDERFTKFDNYHTLDDWKLTQSALTVGDPAPKTTYEDIEGADGSLDLTEALGRLSFDRRTIKWSFVHVGPREEAIRLLDDMRNAIHGREMQIRLQDFPGYYFLGRIEVGEPSLSAGYAEVDVEALCEPYKYREPRTLTVEKSGTYVIKSGRKPVPLNVQSNANFTIKLGGVSVSVTGGVTTYELDDIVLSRGDNEIKITCTMPVVLTWLWGDL